MIHYIVFGKPWCDFHQSPIVMESWDFAGVISKRGGGSPKLMGVTVNDFTEGLKPPNRR